MQYLLSVFYFESAAVSDNGECLTRSPNSLRNGFLSSARRDGVAGGDMTPERGLSEEDSGVCVLDELRRLLFSCLSCAFRKRLAISFDWLKILTKVKTVLNRVCDYSFER